MKKQVLAFAVGIKDAETDRAICIGHRWFPKAAIAEQTLTYGGAIVLVIQPWFVRKNEWLVKDYYGRKITKQVKLQDGTILFQGDPSKVSDGQPKQLTPAQEDEVFQMAVASGMSEKEASDFIIKVRRETK